MKVTGKKEDALLAKNLQGTRGKEAYIAALPRSIWTFSCGAGGRKGITAHIVVSGSRVKTDGRGIKYQSRVTGLDK